MPAEIGVPAEAGTPAGERIGWWLAVEPVGTDAVAWSLIRVGDAVPAGPLAAGLTEGLASLRALAAGLPPRQGVGSEAERRQRLWSGALAVPEQERDVAIRLGQALLPAELRAELRAEPPGTLRHTVTVAGRGWLAQVPWDVLALDPTAGVRLLERAQVVAGLSPTLAVGRFRLPAPRPGAPALRVIDPGPRSGDGLRPLYPGGYPSGYEADDVLAVDEDLLPDGTLFSAQDFGATLRSDTGWSRLLYVGHALSGSGDTPAGAALVFSTAAGADPLTAHAWLREPESWPVPARVALIACASDDSVHVEQSGLPVAVINAGAELLTVTRWTLPADAEPPRRAATTQLALAVDVAHRSTDPIGQLRRWQLQRLAAWRAHGQPDDAPLLWSALATYVVPAPPEPTGSGEGPA